MSYSLQAIYQNSVWAINNNSSILTMLQEQAATGQRINRVSDDPADANRILSLRADSRSMEQYIGTIDEAVSVLELSSSIIESISDELGDARASLTSVLSTTTNDQIESALAEELRAATAQFRVGENTTPQSPQLKR